MMRLKEKATRRMKLVWTKGVVFEAEGYEKETEMQQCEYMEEDH